MEANVDSTPYTLDTTGALIVNLFSNEINRQDVNGLLHAQSLLLEQIDKTNEKLDGINKISAERYLDATRDFTTHTQMLTAMKKDLDLIFKRIKLLKMRLNKKYPETYASVVQIATKRDDSFDNDEDDDVVSAMKPFGGSSLVKSKTVDCSELSASMRETYSLAQINDATTAEQSTSSFDAVRRFVFNKSSGGQEFTTLLKSARDELRRINEGFLGGTSPKQSTSHEE
ncbi:unnamed protein product [Rotaria socialis]|uniref:KxDL domain-containing protein n=2 Tax=Rotaria socialis TaxID=392032 RepID=A0A820WDZ1_9BILA|nr:unnamed protein product [Rotaria socialis]CAF4312523.1 unnamed protein product [Rotaria socialis]CAF4392494.1 unnamed protein product [Rotaria socialis]CAF4515487.1 unnamed protein product [Rotaria socialis]CAF4634579.1 unnamed protein product [Rotaria socialis]